MVTRGTSLPIFGEWFCILWALPNVVVPSVGLELAEVGGAMKSGCKE